MMSTSAKPGGILGASVAPLKLMWSSTNQNLILLIDIVMSLSGSVKDYEWKDFGFGSADAAHG